MKEIYFIKSDFICPFTKFLEISRACSKDIIQIFECQPDLVLNGFSELYGNVGTLGEISNNIPLFFSILDDQSLKLFDFDLNNIIKTNYYIILYYFRNHILLRHTVKYSGNLDTIKFVINQNLSPLVDMIKIRYGFTVNDDLNALLHARDIIDVLYIFENMLLNIGSIIGNNGQVLSYFGDSNLDSFLKRCSCLTGSENIEFLNALFSVYSKMEQISESIKSFLIYGSIAKNRIRPNSDMLDGILIFNSDILSSHGLFKKAFISVIDSNTELLNNRKLSNIHPFHYMFQGDIPALSPHYKHTFRNVAVPLIGKSIKFLDDNISDNDLYFGRYALINNFQKIRNEASNLIIGKEKNNINLFYSELLKFFRKGFLLSALAVKGVFVDEDDSFSVFVNLFPELESGVKKVLSLQECSVLNEKIVLDNIVYIMDFFSLSVNYIYELK